MRREMVTKYFPNFYLQRNSEILLSIESLHRQLGLLLLFESSEVILNQESGVELPHCHFIF